MKVYALSKPPKMAKKPAKLKKMNFTSTPISGGKKSIVLKKIYNNIWFGQILVEKNSLFWVTNLYVTIDLDQFWKADFRIFQQIPKKR